MNTETYRNRVLQVQAALADRGLDLLVVSAPENVLYLGGFWGYAAGFRPVVLATPASGRPVLITPKLESEAAGEMSRVPDIRPYVEWGEPGRPRSAASALERVVSDYGWRSRRIGVESRAVSDSFVRELQDRFPQSRLAPADAVLAEMRLVKSADGYEELTPFPKSIALSAGRTAPQ